MRKSILKFKIRKYMIPYFFSHSSFYIIVRRQLQITIIKALNEYRSMLSERKQLWGIHFLVCLFPAERQKTKELNGKFKRSIQELCFQSPWLFVLFDGHWQWWAISFIASSLLYSTAKLLLILIPKLRKEGRGCQIAAISTTRVKQICKF